MTSGLIFHSWPSHKLKKGRMKWKLRGVHRKSQPITGVKYWIKLLKLRVRVLSLVCANIISFLPSVPNNPHFGSADVPCLTNTQSTKRYQWKTSKPLKFTLSNDPLPFGSIEFILQRKKLWHAFHKAKECSSYVGISEEKVCVHGHRQCKHLVILLASPVEWFRILIAQACALASAENEFI